MKEEYKLLQTYEIFLKLMYISLLKELYDQANRLTNSYMEGEFESKTAEQLTTDNFSYINRDLVGAKQELVKYEALPEKIIFDTSARSYIYEFGGTKEVRAIELYPENKVHRVRERDVHIYVKKSSEGSWVELKNWKFNKDEKNGALKFILKKAVNASSVKVRSVWDDRNVENESIDDYSTFKGKTCNLLRIWTLEDTLQEEYSYDGNSNRISLAENGSGFSYEYYKNTNGGNTAKVKFDGKWYYTYDANGNRTEKAKKLESNGTINKEQEYWTYEWDLWNRLVKVVQYNAPENGECVEVSYEYDALNHRILRKTDTETTKYAYGRNGALAYQEKTKDGKVTKRSFTYLNNEIVGFTDETNAEEEKVYYTVTDIQGSITEVYDGSSKLVWKSGYTAFGEIAGETVDLIDFDGMYTGCDYDAETGLTYHWNRWRSE
ncbi:MAG: RHS repeat protein, partial [Treponema bryantii]|nr:RHS repeat protein [Treponema bryantii]